MENTLRSPREARRRERRRGAEVVEFGLVLLPLVAFVFLTIDIAWAVFARSVLQHAVREGVRYGVTSQLREDMGHAESIRSVVQENSMGLLAGEAGRNSIQVRFYTPETLQDISGTAGANAGGNLIEVSVENLRWAPLLPVLRSAAPLRLSARSADRMEASPPTGAPPL